MTMKYFGEKPYDAPIYDSIPQVPMDDVIGEMCIYCAVKIEAGDRGIVFANGPVAHLTGFLRSTMGSIAHQEGRCSCFTGNSDDDDAHAQMNWCDEGKEILHRLINGQL